MTSGPEVHAWTYDAIDNLTGNDGVVQAYGQGAGPHAVTTVGSVAYAYDANGNLTGTNDGTSLSWNPENMSTAATRAGTLLYEKNFIGEKMWKRVAAGSQERTTYYPFPIVRVEDGRFRKYYAEWAERSAEDGKLRFFHSDHLGSSVLVTGRSGSLVTGRPGSIEHETAYLPYGGVRRGILSGPYTPKKLFQGKDRDATGFFDFGARVYMPSVGQWASADADLDAGLNRYAFVSNNPVNRIDPDGHRGRPSTHIDKNGRIIAVFDDGDTGVYQHPANADRKTPTEYMITKRHERQGTSAGGTRVGATQYWDEFVSPEFGRPYTNHVILVGTRFDTAIEELHNQAKDMDLRQIATNSGKGGKFDFKVIYPGVGALLNGLYVTSDPQVII